ncbi:MAG TPA: hypothetical protein VNB23_10220, partial [Ramlibacter sp.]|nr:hypothetical protein [Ramlibacter sp.]
MDPADPAEVADTTGRVLQLLGFCASHLEHENRFVHAAIEARAAGASDAIAHEHDEHLAYIAQLAQAVAVLQTAPDAQRHALATHLYREFALFIADNFRHMHVEETAHNAVLWARYTDAELVAVHDTLVASIPPDEMMTISRWLVPFMNPLERFHMVADMRAKAPAAAFDALLHAVRPYLAQRDWGKLSRDLALE